METEFGNMKRSDLQRCAKRARIRANMKTEALIEALVEYHSKNAEGGEVRQHPAENQGAQQEAKKVSTVSIRISSSETSEDEMKPSRGQRARKAGRGRKKVTQEEQEMLFIDATNFAEPSIEIDTSVSQKQEEQKEATPAGSETKPVRVSKRETPPAEKPGSEVAPEMQEKQKETTPAATKQQSRRSKRKTPPLAKPSIEIDTSVSQKQEEQKEATPAGSETKPVRVSKRETPPAEKPGSEVAPEMQEKQKETTPAATKQQSRRSKRKTPPLAKTPKSAQKRGHSDTEDAAPPPAKQQKVSPPSEAKDPTPERRSSTRKRTFSMTPPKLEMKGIVEQKDGNKENTPTVTRRSKTKVKKSAPLASTAKKGTPKPSHQKSSLQKSAAPVVKTGIPLPKIKPSVAATATPGKSINLKRAHQKQFDQLESIDDYLERKRKRIEALTQSYKKKKPTSAKKTPQQGNSLSQRETPSQKNKISQQKTPSTPKNPKPVKKESKRTSFFSPKPNPAVKQTVSVTKTVKFQSSKLKTPSRTSAFVFGKTSTTEKRVATPGIRKSVAGMNVSANLQSFSLNSPTPFKFGNTSVVSASVTPAKSKFDLKASLEKPLTYKPYTGKLKPLTEVKPSNGKKPVSHVTKAKEALKRPKLAGRAERQKATARHRMTSRSNNVMARRGLV